MQRLLPFIIFILIVVVFHSNIGFAIGKEKKPKAAVSTLQTPAKTQELQSSGAIRGGQSEQYVSLLDARRTSDAKTRVDRVTIEWGDRVFEKIVKGGYYQIEYREKTLQLILNFSLTLNTKFENQALNKKIGGGNFITNANMEFDSLTQSLVMTINLKDKINLKVSEVDGVLKDKTTAKLVLDLTGAK